MSHKAHDPLPRSDDTSAAACLAEPHPVFRRLRLAAELIAKAPAQKAPGPRLLWSDLQGKVCAHRPGPATVLGRGPDCEVSLSSSRISRRHCRIENSDGACFVEDLGSTNGTLLNGHPLEARTPLVDGDILSLGGETVVFTE
jgi:hypothetical protein